MRWFPPAITVAGSLDVKGQAYLLSCIRVGGIGVAHKVLQFAIEGDKAEKVPVRVLINHHGIGPWVSGCCTREAGCICDARHG